MIAKRATLMSMTYEEYLALEERSETKHEYVRGEVLAMAGGTPDHAALCAAVIVQLGIALAGRPCRVYTSDLRVRVRETDFSAYPDVVVVCGAIELASDDRTAATNPVLLVEVLSDGTESYDRGAKFGHYRRLPSLREYVLVSQHEPRIEVYRRNASGRFELFEVGPGTLCELASIGVSLSVDEVYRDPLAPS